uniref:uncharacterized protein LOC105350366 isoform X1 n=1 Tax=Fragaria vesca subsp. vesca TaxID=101020 RepID=UPI0005CAAFA9|nr:PREDICTED: uncharacterized protein LOC105350366 isoform X1 [Fragaria vesca subsp. vesca]
MGLMVKPGQEGEILDKMYPYIRGGRPYRRSIRFFMKRVREHMDRSSTLDDLKTVEAALKSSIFDDVYGDYKIVNNPSTIMEEDMADAKDPVNQQVTQKSFSFWLK